MAHSTIDIRRWHGWPKRRWWRRRLKRPWWRRAAEAALAGQDVVGAGVPAAIHAGVQYARNRRGRADLRDISTSRVLMSRERRERSDVRAFCTVLDGGHAWPAARLAADGAALPFTPAALVRRGMVMFSEGGGYDVVASLERVALESAVYDIDIERAHNFIAGGIVTHNSIYGFRGGDIKNILEFESCSR